jgi:hypothetical protein
MARKHPKLTTVEKNKHYRIENVADEWVEIELFEHASGFRSINELAPGAVIHFYPAAGGEIDAAYRWFGSGDARQGGRMFH